MQRLFGKRHRALQPSEQSVIQPASRRPNGRQDTSSGSGLLRRLSWAALAVGAAAAFAILFNLSPAGSDPPQGTMSNPQLVSNADGEITLSWDAPSPIPDDYRIVWSENSLGWLSWTRTNEANRGNDYPSGLDGNAVRTSYTISGLTPGDTIKVRGRTRYTPGGFPNSNSHWSGPWTSVVRVTVSGTPESETETETLTISTTEFDVNENETTVASLQATSSDSSITDPLSWTIAGGDDSSHFSLKSNGALAFSSAKDFEAPDDADADGVYEVDVTVTRGEASTTASLEVTLIDVSDDDQRRSEPTIEDEEEDENADGPPAPDAPTVTDVYKTMVIVRWTEPEVEDGDEAITSYDIQYKVHDATQWTDGPQDWTEDPRDRGLFLDIRDLVPDINYLFRVRSQAGETEGPWSDATEQTTALWDSRMRSEPSNSWGGTNGLLGYNSATSNGWFSNRNIVHNGLTRRIETLARYQATGHHTRPIGDDESLRHRVSLDFHVRDHELPADWVLKIGSQTFKISDADHRQERPRRSGRDPHVWLTFWIHSDVRFPIDREIDVALFRDPTLSQRGVDHLPEDEPEFEEQQVGGQADEEEVGGQSDEQEVGGQSDGGKVPVTVTNPEPTQVKARVTDDGVVLTWNAPTEGNVISYRIYRGTDPNNLSVLVYDTGSTDTSYVDRTVEEGTAYAYAVQPNLEDTSGLNGGTGTRGLGNSGLTLEDLLNGGNGQRIVTRNQDPQNNENTVSALVWVRTLVTIEVRVGPDRSLLRSLPQDSSGTQILPVSTPNAIFRHTWMNATLEEYVHYAADLEQNSFYSLVLWDPQHAENSLQLSGGYFIHDFQNYGPGANLLVYDIQDEIREISETLAQGGPLIPEVYYFHLTGIRVGAKNGPDLYTAPRDSQWGDLSQLHYIPLGTYVRSYVFSTGETPGWHYFELRMRRSHLVHHIRLEKLYDHPDLPSSVATIKRTAKVKGRYGWLEGSEYGVITPGDEDWFRIYLEGNKHYEFVLAGSGSFLNLERGEIVGLSGPDGILIPSTTSGGSRLGYRTPVDGGGNYYVGVRSSSDAGTGVYRITARETDIGSGTGTQVTLPLGTEYLSFFHEPNDRDTFKVEVKADRKYRARIYPYGDRGSPWSLRHSFDLHIEDDICERNTCSRVTDHKRDIRNAGNHSEMVEFSTRQDTTVYITVTNEDGFRGSYYFKVWDHGPDN